MHSKALQDAGSSARRPEACDVHAQGILKVVPPAGAGGTDSGGQAESGQEAQELNGVHHAAKSSPSVQAPTAATQHAQAVDLSNLFAGIWMDSADDADTAKAGELGAGSESPLKYCISSGL